MQRKLRLALAALFSPWIAASLEGCSEVVLLHPKGPIGESELFVIAAAFGLMLIVVIPVIVMVFWFPMKYRSSSTNAAYDPKWSYSPRLELIIWMVPFAIVIVLAHLTWTRTYRLDPYEPIASDIEPVNIQVVALDWKWLFIYPDYNIAAINQLVIPVHTPLSFRITSDTVMNSFFIPQLGSQIYAMAGMESRLHLLASEPGVYRGQSQQFCGNGYAYMRFEAKAVSDNEFAAWVQKTMESPNKLEWSRFEELQHPSVANPVAHFSAVTPGLFGRIIGQYKAMSTNAHAGEDGSGAEQMEGSVPEGQEICLGN